MYSLDSHDSEHLEHVEWMHLSMLNPGVTASPNREVTTNVTNSANANGRELSS
ncbi:hypothetical protein [Cerasicoccus frondis]|uniref:hypothetical protein n=1 Tax=Cerasicoccus frondis TaxID=490090 RepID=UPI002852A324|nr:hypothetical protein [Cerasicoccus frondis]